VSALNLADAFVLFFTLVGPQKVLLSVIWMARTRDARSVRRVVTYAAVSAAVIGITCALSAPWVAEFFHITRASVELAAGLVFFTYASGLVFGVHFGEGDFEVEDEADAQHPVVSGYRELLVPFIVSPLGVAAVIDVSLTAANWEGRVTVAGAYMAVVAVDLASALTLLPMLRRAHPTSLEVLSRLLGILLTAVGVQLFLQGLAGLGVHMSTGH
jgi:multiple antibiotic resistance protein